MDKIQILQAEIVALGIQIQTYAQISSLSIIGSRDADVLNEASSKAIYARVQAGLALFQARDELQGLQDDSLHHVTR